MQLTATDVPRTTAEQLAQHATRLAREYDALQDFVALVAHDLRSVLISALVSDEPSESVIRGIEIVESILEAAQVDHAGEASAHVESCLDQALADLGTIAADVTASVTSDAPLSGVALRIVLRNILTNAVAAGSRRIHVSTAERRRTYAIVVDDDGIGMSNDRYATGAGLGLALCGRLIARFGGALELAPGARGGSRATIAFAWEKP